MPYCEECGKKIVETAKFCPNCSAEITHKSKKTEKMAKNKEKPSTNDKNTSSTGVISLVVILGIITALFAIQVPASYSVQEIYTVQEPYKISVQKKIDYRVVNSGSSGGLSGLNYVTNGWVIIKNTDTEPGTFVVSCDFKTLKRTLTGSDRVYVLPGEQKTANCQGDTKIGEDVAVSYEITPSTKTVMETRYKSVEKTRTVQKTGNVRLYQKIFGWY
ncbi:MAG: zinc ribbon domain-containing protein [Candidatus Aenigmarchaeota archaeon]|nr:zinc ribbon domain-containing protein [Candidatus Aenigmarchaeota archaeon]